MNEQKADACRVNKGEEGIVENLGDEVGNGFDFGFLDKMEVGQMDEDEKKNSGTGVGHGFRAQSTAACTGFDVVFAAAGLAVFQKEDNSGNDVQEEDGVKPDFKNGYKNA